MSQLAALPQKWSKHEGLTKAMIVIHSICAFVCGGDYFHSNRVRYEIVIIASVATTPKMSRADDLAKHLIWQNTKCPRRGVRL